MLRIVDDFTGNILGFVAEGHIVPEDYTEVLTPAVEAALKKYDRLRIYYEFSASFSSMEPSAMWEDFKLGLGHMTCWDRIAIVTDIDLIKLCINAFRFLMPFKIKVFNLAHKAEAREWLAE